MNREEIIAAIRRELDRRGITAYRAAISAGLPENAIRYVLEGRDSKTSRLSAICSALGLEFYIGPPRDQQVVIEQMAEALGLPRLTGVEEIIEKIESLNRWDPAALQAHLDEAEVAIQKWRSKTVETVVEIVKHMKVSSPGTSVAEAARAVQMRNNDLNKDDGALAHPPISGKIIDFPGARPVAISEHLKSAAGGGAMDLDETVTGYAYFREDWLKRHRLDPGKCRVIGVMGESMQPTLPEGCSILVDFNRKTLRKEHIFVLRTDIGVVVKRAREGKHGQWLLVSDHPTWETKPWPDDAKIIGEVKWMAKTL